MSLLGFLAHGILLVIESAGYIGIFFLMAVGSTGIPIPSEITIPFAAFGASRGVFYFPFVVAVGIAGSITGSVFLYWIGRHGGRPLVEKYGHMVWIPAQRLSKLDYWFARFGIWAVFFGQMIPGVRAYIALPAGLTAIRLPQFIFAAGLGAGIWILFLGIVGALLGERWESISPLFHRFELGIFVILILIVIGYIGLRVRGRRSKAL